MVKISRTKHVTKDRIVKRNPVHKKKVPLYNMKSISNKLMNTIGKFPAGKDKADYEFNTKYYIVVGPKGVVVSYDDEGVHSIKKDLNDTIDLDIYKKERTKDLGGGKKQIFTSIVPIGSIKISIKDILSMNPSVKMTHVKDMVRTFGSRLDRNYALLLQSLKRIGLNLNEYNIKRKGARYGL